MSKLMTVTQTTALALMRQRGVGAVYVGGAGWLFREDVRENERAAEFVAAKLKGKPAVTVPAICEVCGFAETRGFVMRGSRRRAACGDCMASERAS